jgi:hypothetical protein
MVLVSEDTGISRVLSNYRECTVPARIMETSEDSLTVETKEKGKSSFLISNKVSWLVKPQSMGDYEPSS